MCYMSDRTILVPEVEGKTISSMRFYLTGPSGEAEVDIDFTDGTSFSSRTSPKMEFSAEFYIGGIGFPQIIRRYGEF
jgi:hypothetical protein